MKLKNKIKLLIACDGGAASGKTTAAKLISKKYKLHFLSSGLLYRYISYKLLSKRKILNKNIYIKKISENITLKKLNRAMTMIFCMTKSVRVIYIGIGKSKYMIIVLGIIIIKIYLTLNLLAD